MIIETINGFRLSSGQKRLWLLQQDSDAYLTQGSILVEGHLQPEVLKAAIQQIVNRHEILRTRFSRLPGVKTPIMIVLDSSSLLWQYIDLSDCYQQEQSSKVEEVFQENKYKVFDLEQGLILRMILVKLSNQKYSLLIYLPAICADTQTIKNLVNEISHSYYCCVEEQKIDNEAVQFIQFSEWQNELLTDEDAPTANEYWFQQKIASLATIKLPFENKCLKKSAFEIDCFQLVISSKLIAIENLALKYDTTVAVVLLACWQTLIWRLTGESEIVIGTACDRREYEELNDVLGLLATWIPIKTHFIPDLRFQEVLELDRKTLDDAIEWQDYFVPESVEKGNILAFPIGFEFEQLPEKCFANNVSFSLEKFSSCIEPFKVKLTCTQHQNSLVAEFYYDVNYFSNDTIERLAGYFQTLLTSATANPAQKISQLEMISASDRQQLLVLNQTQINYPKDKCIHQLFTEQVEKTPNNIAVVFEDQQLTYAQLNRKANQLAHYLQKLGVKPEVVVGLCVERSLEIIVGLLGILKAGGAYLPLDPTLPTSSITWRSQDAQVPILLTQQHLVERLSESTAQIVSLDSDWQVINQQASENLTSQVKSENSAYVIYTSGSTGVPKGVVVEHQQLLNYLHSIQEILNLPPDASFATVSTFAADLGNTAIFPSLCRGGCLHVISSDRAADPQALADYFHRYAIDCLKIVPTHLKALLTSQTNKQILPRQRLVLGGEATSWNLIEQIRQLAPECEIINHYGPTETTVGVTTFKVSKEATSEEYETVPIGRPLPNTQIYLLDSLGQLVPMGVPGELHIGGACLARGYLHRRDLTAEKFINDPFNPGKRLYKTGDLVRYLSDGNIEFLGRIDNQVKVHGFRIELGEIETALLKHPAVSETVVIAQEDETGNKRLVAYVVPKHEAAPASTELRQFLLELLPEYILPAFFVQLKALPLTANGKVNRQMLPAPNTTRPELKAAYVAPRTAKEEILAQIWAQVLKVQQVSIHDNFFELGGDSIISIQIVARANQQGLKLTPKQLFEHQTVADLAAVADTNRVTQAEQGLVTGQMPLTPIQHWFFEQNQPVPHHWNQAILLQVQQVMPLATSLTNAPVLLEKAVQHLLLHHDALRLRFVKAESGWQQINADAEEITPFIRLDLSALSEVDGKSVIETTVNQLQTSLNLLLGPLVRVAFFEFGKNKPSKLLIIIHHLAVDGVSWRILLEDLQTAYEQLERGEVIQLPAKTTSFKQWAEKLTEYTHSAAVHQELDYWLSQAKKLVPCLPVDYLGNENTLVSEKTISIKLSVEETQALLQKVPAAYGTQINDVLLTALVQAFAQWTGEKLLLVELEGHGREEIFADVDLSRTVGWFTTHFPVLLSLEEVDNLGAALKLVKEQLRGIPKRGIGYGLLRYLNKDEETIKQLQALPEAEVKFNYLGQFDQVLSSSSLFEPAQESSGAERSLQGSRNRLLVINGLIASGQLQLNWNYCENIHHQTTIENLAQSFVEALHKLIHHCQSSDAGGYTPSDFPQMQFSSQELDELLAEL
ncbi:amino acid adenylation domain-containing protein [Nostoc sp.]|uniref:amino acid adenylation domain-containing protein n=1 Tax=Nostoc sp. TaxID=1180 RepID=UPI002FFBA97A